MAEWEIRIRVTAPDGNAERHAAAIADLVRAEYDDALRLAVDGPRLVEPGACGCGCHGEADGG